MKRLCKRILAGVLAASMVIGMGYVSPKAEVHAENGDSVTYDFRDGSIIPTDTDGKSDVTKDALTVKVGTKNAYKYNGAQHGVEFKAGNTIEIKVDGPTKVIVGDCQYSKMAELTLTNADGSWSQTQTAKTGCYHNDGSAITFKYPGEATTLVLGFESSVYIPCITVVEGIEDTPDDNGVPADSIFMYNFADGSVVPTSNDSATPVSGTVTSKDGFLSVISNGQTYYHDKDHGLAVKNGDVIEVKVAGDSVITFSTCEYGTGGYWQAKTEKGEIVSETAQPAQQNAYDGISSVFKYEGVATTLTFTLAGATGEAYLHGVNVANLPAETETPELVGNGKIDVWDFAAEELDTEKYNNMLTVDLINSWYESKFEQGSAGATINSFATNDILFNASGKTNNRLRTMNEAITRYDAKSKSYTEEDGSTTQLNGFVYSNSGSTSRVYVGIKLYEGDIFTAYTASNGGEATIYFESPSGKIEKATSVGNGSKLTFYASEYGIYKLYTLDEKLVVCRMYREHTAPVLVKGKVTAPDSLKNYELAFTNDKTGAVTTVAPAADGSYEIWLRDTYSYTVTLLNANGYVIKSGDALNVTKEVQADINVETVDLVTMTGKLTGLSEAALAALKLSFVNPEYAYVPEFTLDGASISVKFERGVTYEIVAENINDYYLSELTSICLTEDKEQNIAFMAKQVYEVTFDTTGISAEDWANAVVTLSNINEAGYVYTFKPAEEKVMLRDGQYAVSVAGVGNSVAQKRTADVKVNGAATTSKIGFETLTEWDFGKLNKAYGGAGIETIGDGIYYSGLVLNNQVLENKTYLLLNKGGEIKVPVKAGDIITANYCYCAGFQFNGDEATIVDEKSGSTSKIDTVTYTATEDGFVTISSIEGVNSSQTYFTSIVVTTPLEYKATVTVGKNKEYTTINDALDAIARMQRTDDQRVTVLIDPGDYEEMLVIDLPNITLKNAAEREEEVYTVVKGDMLKEIAKKCKKNIFDIIELNALVNPDLILIGQKIRIPSEGGAASIEITNKGVDIAENAVRITSYYGHGYSYYSMGTDCKYDAELLEINKSNGYLGFKNPGTGTTSGSYWNATVVVYASGFEADGIIFENSFNQYISEKEANDIVVMEVGNKGERSTTAGDTSVQTKSFVERAAALAIADNCTNVYFNNCKFVGRQDTLYGGKDSVVAFNECDILGACDYIFGGMTAVFNECNLVMNTSEASADVAYITAAQQAGSRGYLFYDCVVTSTTPGVDTASEYGSKPGYFGRPWAANTSEVVFYNTTVEASCEYYGEESLIKPEGWLNSLGGESTMMYEYGTKELSGEDNLASRASWSTVLTEPVLSDGTDISTKEKAIAAFLGEWDPFK